MGQDYEVSFQKIFCFHNLDYYQETLPSDTAGVRPGTTGLALMVVSYIDMMIQVTERLIMSHVTAILI